MKLFKTKIATILFIVLPIALLVLMSTDMIDKMAYRDAVAEFNKMDPAISFSGDYHVIKTCKPVTGLVGCVDTQATMSVDLDLNRITIIRHGNIDGRRLIYFEIDSFDVDADGVFEAFFVPNDGIDGWIIIDKNKENGILCQGQYVIKLYFKK